MISCLTKASSSFDTSCTQEKLSFTMSQSSATISTSVLATTKPLKRPKFAIIPQATSVSDSDIKSQYSFQGSAQSPGPGAFAPQLSGKRSNIREILQKFQQGSSSITQNASTSSTSRAQNSSSSSTISLKRSILGTFKKQVKTKRKYRNTVV